MNKKSKFLPLIVCFFLLIGLGISCGGNQEAQQGTSEEGRRQGTAFDNPATNLQILEVEKPEDLRPIMRAFNVGLGCTVSFVTRKRISQKTQSRKSEPAT